MSHPEPDSTPDPRVRMAAERTLLAWVRTGVALMGFGFVVARFGWFLREFAAREQPPSHPAGWSSALGVGLVALGVVVNAAAGAGHARFLRRHDAGLPYRPPAWSLGLVVAAALVALGVVMAGYLLILATG